jgi:hypothetical protein
MPTSRALYAEHGLLGFKRVDTDDDVLFFGRPIE